MSALNLSSDSIIPLADDSEDGEGLGVPFHSPNPQRIRKGDSSKNVRVSL